MTSSIAGKSSMMSSSFTEVPMHLFALGISESIMFPWTQAEETEETAAENGGGGGASSSPEA